MDASSGALDANRSLSRTWKKVMTDKRNERLWIIIAAAIIVRLVAALYLGDRVVALPGTYDQISYHTLAFRVLDGHGFTFETQWWPITAAGEPTAHWSFLYTLFLTVVYRLFGTHPLIARLIQAALVGFLQPLLAFLLGRRLAGERVGIVAALLTGFYAYFIYYAGALMTEPFYMTGILAALYMTLRLGEGQGGRQRTMLVIGLGLTSGVVILLRQLFLFFVPLLVLWWWWMSYRESRQVPIRHTIIVCAVIVVMIVPFTIYNYARFDQFVLLNTNAGYAFFWANHPIYGTQFEPILPPEMGSYEELIPPELRHLNEAALDRALLERGLGYVREDPGRYLLLSLSRIPSYFMFWPSAESGLISNVARLASFGLLWPFMVVGAGQALWRARRGVMPGGAVILLLLFASSYTAMHLLSWALIRYRLPVDAVMLVLAAAAIVEILGWLPHPAFRGRAISLPEH